MQSEAGKNLLSSKPTTTQTNEKRHGRLRLHQHDLVTALHSSPHPLLCTMRFLRFCLVCKRSFPSSKLEASCFDCCWKAAAGELSRSFIIVLNRPSRFALLIVSIPLLAFNLQSLKGRNLLCSILLNLVDCSFQLVQSISLLGQSWHSVLLQCFQQLHLCMLGSFRNAPFS